MASHMNLSHHDLSLQAISSAGLRYEHTTFQNARYVLTVCLLSL